MAKATQSEKSLARIYYVERGKTASDIANLLGRKANTIGRWVEIGKWKEERDALLFSNEQRIKDLKNIISNCATERLELSNQLTQANKGKDTVLAKSLRLQMVGLSDEVAKWNKTLQSLQNADRVTLAQRLGIQDDIFTKIRQSQPTIYKEYILRIEEQLLQQTIQMYD